MPTVTALELVNRVRRRLRWGDVSNVTDTQSVAILDLVNGAVADVLDEKQWESDIRHDGVIRTMPAVDVTDLALNAGNSTAISLSLGVYIRNEPPLFGQNEYLTGAKILRMEYTGDTVSADADLVGTVWRIAIAQKVLGAALMTLDAGWAGTTSSSTSKARFFVCEYLLPDTVKQVISVRHQGEPLTLEHIDAAATWDRAVPRLSDDYGEPYWVGVGGYDLNTYSVNALGTGNEHDQTEPRLRLILYPVPTTQLRIDYSYYYRHPRLVSKDDVLAGVPAGLVEDIVKLAVGDATATLERSVTDGLRMGGAARRANNEKHANQDSQPNRRHVVESWNRHRGSRWNVRRGFPGQTIEGP